MKLFISQPIAQIIVKNNNKETNQDADIAGAWHFQFPNFDLTIEEFNVNVASICAKLI